MASTLNASNSGAGGLISTADASGVLQLQSAGTTAVTIDTSQNVGIGTTSPSQKLHVYRNTSTTDAQIQSEQAGAGEATVGFLKTGVYAWLTGISTDYSYRIAGSGASLTTNTRFMIDTSGNVGIGTSSPKTNSGYTTLTLNNASSGGVLEFTNNNTTVAQLYNTGTDFYTYSASGKNIVFDASGLAYIKMNTNGTERMRIDSSGYVRVNNTSGIDGQFSSVTGSFYAAAFSNSDAAYATAYSWNKATSGNNIFYQFFTENPATNRGTIDYNRGAGLVRYNTTSDVRLKENIVDAPSAIDLINSVKIRSFDWKETGFHVDYGVIAQELNEVVPEAVSIGEDDEDGTIKRSWGVDTSVLVPALVKTVQEQQTIINDLKARVTALEAK
jgi:hypothetical protein